jgi:hypothetical protein
MRGWGGPGQKGRTELPLPGRHYCLGSGGAACNPAIARPNRRSVSHSSRDPDRGWQPCLSQVDAVTAHRDAFLNQELALSRSHRDAPVSADHAMPWEAFVGGRKNATDQPGRSRVDVAVGADKSDRNRAHPANNASSSRFEAVTLRRHSVYFACESRSPQLRERGRPSRRRDGARHHLQVHRTVRSCVGPAGG